MCIINIRGTHGSGKSTIVRNVMDRYPVQTPQYVPDRKRPAWYLCQRDSRSLAVIGHYETACGGCDTIPSVDAAYEYIRAAARDGHDVIFEGILVGYDVRRYIELRAAGHDVVVIFLDVPFEDCYRAVKERRLARGDTRPLKPDNIEKRPRHRQQGPRFAAGGVRTVVAGRDEAAALCYRWLGLEQLTPCATPANTLF